LLFAVLVGLALDTVWMLVGFSTSLLDVRDRLNRGAIDVEAERFPSAQEHFSHAAESGRSAVSFTQHPSFVLASLLPGIGRDFRAGRALAAASELSARAGLELVDAADAIQSEEGGLAGSLYRSGRLQFESVGTAMPFVRNIDDLLSEAAAILNEAPEPILGPIGKRFGAARSLVNGTSVSAHRATVLLEALPSLLGKDVARRYLLAFQSPSEARGTGGLLGQYGVLEAREGRLRLTHVAPIGELTAQLHRPVEPPTSWYERAYGPLSGLREWQQANLSPHFPVVSQVWLEMYEAATGDRLDGVIAMDPIALGELTRATGALRGEGWDVTIGPDNAAQVLLHDSYVELDRAAQNRFLVGVIRNFWDSVQRGNVSAPRMVAALGEATRTHHFKAFSIYEGDQTALEQLDADGLYSSLGSNVQLVFHNSYSVSKVDYFLKRSIETEVRILADGAAEVTSTVTLDNNAPSGPPSLLLEPGVKGQPLGTNAMVLHFLLPEGSTVQRFEVDGVSLEPLLLQEAAHSVAAELVTVPSGQQARALISYRIPSAARISDDGGEFAMTLFPQTVVNADRFSLSVTAPEGFSVEEPVTRPEIDVTSQKGSLVFSGTLEEPATIQVELVP
jgi:hypothetical protein